MWCGPLAGVLVVHALEPVVHVRHRFAAAADGGISVVREEHAAEAVDVAARRAVPRAYSQRLVVVGEQLPDRLAPSRVRCRTRSAGRASRSAHRSGSGRRNRRPRFSQTAGAVSADLPRGGCRTVVRLLADLRGIRARSPVPSGGALELLRPRPALLESHSLSPSFAAACAARR